MAEMRMAAFSTDVPEGGMRQVEADGVKVLLIRRGETVTAIGGVCPHAGGPLAEGVLDGGRVFCPWHKAAFCTRTGKLLDPPAVDDLPTYQVERRGEELWLDPAPLAAAPLLHPGADPRCFVVVGGGGAGAAAVRELRVAGFTGRLVLVEREDLLPYDRTLLSKYTLSGEEGGEKSPLQDAAFYRQNKIERRIGEVVALDPVAKTIRFATGDVLAYDAALLAPGSRPNPPKFAGAEDAGIFLLRNFHDAQRIVAAAQGTKRAVVIGASFIAMEAAAALTERGLAVTVIAPDAAPFEKQLGATIGNVFRRLHEQNSVTFRFGEKIARVDAGSITLETGETIKTDLIVAGLGVAPETGWLTNLPRDDHGGLLVDASLKVSDGLYAAGDIASFPARGDGPPQRVEHWRVAQQHGSLAARAMLGEAVRYDSVPVFWTIQYMKRLDYVGHASGSDELVIRGDLEKPEFIAYYLQNGKVAAAAGFDRDQEIAAIIALMERRRDWTVDELHPLDSSPTAVLASLHKSA